MHYLKLYVKIMCLPTVLTTYCSYFKSYKSQHISQYSCRFGSKIIPPKRVKCPSTQNNIEVFEELKKVFHQGGNAQSSLSSYSNIKLQIIILEIIILIVVALLWSDEILRDLAQNLGKLFLVYTVQHLNSSLRHLKNCSTC